MTLLRDDIAAFDRMHSELKARRHKQWVVFYKGELFDAFPDFEAAASAAVDRFGAGPYLIRQVGAPQTVQLPGGMVFTPAHIQGSGRLQERQGGQ